MADEIRERLLEQVKEQGDIVRKLKAAKTNSNEDLTNSWDIETELESINQDFADVSYVCGWVPTAKDAVLFDFCVNLREQLSKWPHLKRWFINIQSFDRAERIAFPDPEGQVASSLTRKVDRICDLCLFDRNTIDEKVRQLFARKQSCYKL